jgi:transposase-like protein
MVRPNRDRIGGKLPVEIDETYVGGKTRGEGRGVHHGIIVAGAVEVCQRKPQDKAGKAAPRRGGRYAGRLRLSIVPNRTAKSLCRFVDDSVEESTFVVTDDWKGYSSLKERGYDHLPVAEKGSAKIAEDYLPLIHLVFSNLKSWLIGVHHGVEAQHLQAYLNEFTFRFNRRFYPFNSFRSLLGIAADSEAHTYAGLYAGRPEHAGEIRESA